MDRTETGSLHYGVEYPPDSGQLHFDFALRLPTVGDNIEALEAHGSGSMLRLNTAMLASCLLKLGDIPVDAIDYALLEGMVDDDFDILAAARDALKKKRKRPSDSLPDCDSPSSPSANTASASSAPAS